MNVELLPYAWFSAKEPQDDMADILKLVVYIFVMQILRGV